MPLIFKITFLKIKDNSPTEACLQTSQDLFVLFSCFDFNK